jgi:hypothetical protein
VSEKDVRQRYITALLEFVERASKPGATREEIEALPQIAEALGEILQYS